MNDIVYLVMQTVRDDNGYIPCIAERNISGFSKTNWRWNCDYEQAEELVDKMNLKLGWNKNEALKIVLSSMRREE